MNTPVSFELAKLLKEKEIYIPAFHYYENEVLKEPYLENGSSTDTEFRVELSDLKEYFNKWSKKISAPTIAEVVMWLYEKHGIWIQVISKNTSTQMSFKYEIKRYEWDGCITDDNLYNSPTEANESGIKHILENSSRNRWN